MTRRRKSPRQPTPRQPAHHAPRPPAVPATARDTASGPSASDGLPLSHLPSSPSGASHALELPAPATAGLADVILELAGADHAGLRATLTAWQREQDRILNRAWRHPGGLARPAGL